MQLKIYTLDNEDQWNKTLIDHFQDQVDIYYRPSYFRSWVTHELAEPICLHIQNKEFNWLYPFLKKEIPNSGESEPYYDIFSAYGYGGIVSNRSISQIPDEFRTSANIEIDRWCQEHRIVAEFIRENPLLGDKDTYFRNIFHSLVRQNVYAQTNESYKIGSRSARRNIQKAMRRGLEVVVNEDLSSIDNFSDLYMQTAKHLKMDRYYYFGRDYFRAVRDYLSPWSKIINIVADGRAVAAALCFLSSGFATYHLSCSDATYLKSYPNDLLLKAVVDESLDKGARLLSLGGGMSTSHCDSLFKFKRRFGTEIRPVYIGKRIHQKSQYDRLCQQWEVKHPDLVSPYGHYFLKYRVLS